MPAGLSWGRYLTMLSATLFTMLAGAQVVHQYYRPDLSIPEVPPKPGELRTELLGLKERSQKNSALTVMEDKESPHPSKK